MESKFFKKIAKAVWTVTVILVALSMVVFLLIPVFG